MILDPIIRASRATSLRSNGQWRDIPLLHYFDEAVAKGQDRVAIVDCREGAPPRQITYGELDEASRCIAANLTRLGVRRGDVVSFQLPNWWEFVAIHLGCLRCGAASNPLMPIFRQRELSFMLAYAQSRVVIVPKRFRGFDHAALIHSLKPGLPHLEHLVVVGEDGDEGFENTLLAPCDTPLIEPPLSADEVVQVLYTSGTTGMPKGVMHSSNTLLANVRPYVERLGLDGRDAVFMGSPLAHQTGFLYGMWLPIVLQTTLSLMDVWDKERAWAIIQSQKCSFTMASTPFLADLLSAAAAPRAGEVALRMLACGGAPIPRALAEQAVARLGLKLLSVYGMSENGAITVTAPDAPADKVFSADGSPLPGVRVRVVDAEGREMPCGEEGRLLIHAPSNFLGYLLKPEAYGMDAEDWFDSGDLARMDAEGYIRITGRSKDIIIRGGENVPVVEVENLLYRHPAIVDAAVVGMPHPRLGETGCCFVSLKPGQGFDLATLRQYLDSAGMTRNYWPERVEIVENFPRTASGKIQKFQLREIARQFATASAAS
ncbi:MAG: AMP-binding protein [Polaromonas sp.]|uniref:AMP-binding protein n=1 Tax=Polaromonas sp. TaxID=1869339 RepID=UPI0027329B97|nr:AMP-binding protein [Polaromonas sp.]MDP3248843.1 AMP-binding protein [Polaromonas sp.]